MPETLAGLPNAQLLARVRELVQRGNAVEAELLAHLGEVDARGLHLGEGCSSMFVYCQRVLHFAEGVAYKRIQAARAARRHPELLEAVRRGELHLTAVGLLAPKLTASNCAELIQAARHRSAEEVRRLLADREPRPALPASVRKLPEPAKQASAAVLPQVALPQVVRPHASLTLGEPPIPPPTPRQTTSEKGKIEPLGAERYRVQFTADRELHAQLQELRALMRHQVPDGDLGKILARAVAALLAQVRKRKFAETPKPRPARHSASPNEIPSRHIPAAIRRAVWRRDAGRCSYVSAGGRRCDSREFLEFDHAEAWAWKRAHSIESITLRCRAHNQQRARLDFGEPHMARFDRHSLSSAAGPGSDPNRAGARGAGDQLSTGFESSHPQLTRVSS
jgi:5-methylcytosine-specific restriction endonuclease McrA